MTGENPPSIWMRPEHAGVGRPARYSRAQITAAAVGIADREGLDAVSMRRVAAELGTGAASLYRYIGTREDLLDLMTDAVGAEQPPPRPTGDWVADLVAVSEGFRSVLRRHPWLPSLVLTRPVLGPNGLDVLEHVLSALAAHPASIAAKMEAFAILNSMAATSVQYELAGGSALMERAVAYLAHAVASGDRPRLKRLLSQGPAPEPAPDPEDRYPDVLARVLTGLLGPG